MNPPDPNIILTILFSKIIILLFHVYILLKNLDENKTWGEIIDFFYEKYPLIDTILKNYYEYKFLRKPTQYGFS